jgi:hypothetical protein
MDSAPACSPTTSPGVSEPTVYLEPTTPLAPNRNRNTNDAIGSYGVVRLDFCKVPSSAGSASSSYSEGGSESGETSESSDNELNSPFTPLTKSLTFTPNTTRSPFTPVNNQAKTCSTTTPDLLMSGDIGSPTPPSRLRLPLGTIAEFPYDVSTSYKFQRSPRSQTHERCSPFFHQHAKPRTAPPHCFGYDSSYLRACYVPARVRSMGCLRAAAMGEGVDQNRKGCDDAFVWRDIP